MKRVIIQSMVYSVTITMTISVYNVVSKIPSLIVLPRKYI